MRYASVIVNKKSNATDRPFAYAVPALNMSEVRVGSKVFIPFAKSRLPHEGYVVSVMDEPPAGVKNIREIIGVDEEHSLSEEMMEAAAWMRERYFLKHADAIGCFAANVVGGGAANVAEGGAANIAEGGAANIAEDGAANIAEDGVGAANVVGGGAANVVGSGATFITDGFSANAGGVGGVGGVGGDAHIAPPPSPAAPPSAAPKLTAEQEAATTQILPAMEKGEYKTFLLHGVTGSGKTEVYMAATEKCLGMGKAAIILVPEISLTLQTVERFKARFGEEIVAVIHSGRAKGKRYEEWLRIRRGAARIILGVRSAIFAPAENIGLIVLDEEHETSYKSDMTPKFDAVEVAIKRAHIAGGVTILGSATPSMVSMQRAKRGYYELLTLRRRYNNLPMPRVRVVDMREEILSGNTSIFSHALADEMRRAKEAGKQSLLFLNRRGYAPTLTCMNCGETLKCEDCDISLTYHKGIDKLVCHFCGKVSGVPRVCPSCGKEQLRMIGFGTEKLEEVTKEKFPELSVSRIDLDTIRRKGELRRLLGDFTKGKTDVLVGTQIIAKGLDFENVGVVGVVLADLGLNLPDFRSLERTFALITQVSGRAGRREERGEVVVQTFQPENYAVKLGSLGDYGGFFKEELHMRKLLGYPPFSEFVQLLISGKDEGKAASGADVIAYRLRELKSKNVVIGPSRAPVAKISGNYRYMIYIKIFAEHKREYWETLREMVGEVNLDGKNGYMLGVDVNPYSFM